MKELLDPSDSRMIQVNFELEVVDEFSPKQMSDVELTTAINEICGKIDGNLSMKNMGQIMSSLKAEHDGMFDPKVASGLVRAKIQENEDSLSH